MIIIPAHELDVRQQQCKGTIVCLVIHKTIGARELSGSEGFVEIYTESESTVLESIEETGRSTQHAVLERLA